MSRRGCIVALVMLFMMNASARAQQPEELLIPVDEATQARLLDKSNFDFRRQLYEARRYKIVKINLALLEKAGAEFTITPFDDLQMTVATQEVLSPSSSPQLLNWRGRLMSPTVNSSGLISESLFQMNITVRTGERLVPISVAKRVLADQQATTAPGISFGPRDDAPGVMMKVNLTEVFAEWLVVVGHMTMVIRPIESDPRFHVIFERDQSKMSSGGADLQEKQRRRQQFMEQLERERQESLREQ